MTIVPSSGKDFANHSIACVPEHIKSAVIKFTGDNYTNQSKEIFNSPAKRRWFLNASIDLATYVSMSVLGDEFSLLINIGYQASETNQSSF